jgi:hypothetical protein
MDERRERLAKNEALFREVNERIQEIGSAVGVQPDEELEMVCECSNAGCTERMTMNKQEYEQVRADAELFVLVPGHEDATMEEVVSSGPRYSVVRKHPGTPSRVAIELDPRS